MKAGVRRLIRNVLLYLPRSQEAKHLLQRTAFTLLRVPFEREFEALRLFPRQPGALYLDIGGNQGFAVDAILMFRPESRVFSFEPNPPVAARAQQHFARDPRVDIFPLGLGNREGVSRLYVPVYRGFVFSALASFDRVQARSWLNKEEVLGFNEAELEIHECDCHVRTLDSLELDPFFMKIEVQGFEQEVLEGGRRTIADSKPVILLGSALGCHGEFLAAFGYRQYLYDRKRGRFHRYDGDHAGSFYLTEDKLRLLQDQAASPIPPLQRS